MANTEVHRFLDPYRSSVNKDKEFNLQSQNSSTCYGGLWAIPHDEKYEEFLNKIIEKITNDENAKLHFLERPNKDFNMIKFDIDLRFEPEANEIKDQTKIKRRYTQGFIEEIVNVLTDIINKNIIQETKYRNKYNVYVQEKEKPRITHNSKEQTKMNHSTIKDGIHILIPDIVMSNMTLHYLRHLIINDTRIKEMLQYINVVNDIADVFDKVIIDTNAWFIYGCGKPDDAGLYYKVTSTYKVLDPYSENKPIKVHNNKTFKEYVMLFSNYGKIKNLEFDVPNDFKIKLDKLNPGERKQIIDLFDKTIARSNLNLKHQSDLKAPQIEPFLSCIKKERADDFNDWRNIGISLFNMDTRNYEIWNKWSSQSDKYDEERCFIEWHVSFLKNAHYNLGLKQIKEMASKDNPEKYNEITDANKNFFFMEWLNVFSNDITNKNIDMSLTADFIKCYMKDYSDINAVCIVPGTPSKAEWYRFQQHKWSEDAKAHSIYMMISTCLIQDLSKIYQRLREDVFRQDTDSLTALFGPNNGTPPQDLTSEESLIRAMHHSANKKREEMCFKLLGTLKDLDKRDKILRDLSHKCHDENFYKCLDSNKLVFVCLNGVMDLEKCIFRPGQPTDLVTFSSNVEYPSDEDCPEATEIEIEILEFFRQLFPDNDLMEYVLNICALKLSGESIGEKLIIFSGRGQNGKTVFEDFMCAVFGDYYKHMDNTVLNLPKTNPDAPNPEIFALRGKRIVLTSEPDSDKQFKPEKIKELTGGDKLSARNLFDKKKMEFSPQYVLGVFCNDIPENDSTDFGFWRRIEIIEFESQFLTQPSEFYKLDDPVKFKNHFKADLEIKGKFAKWAPYVLQMLFKRYIYLKQNNKKVAPPKRVMEAVDKYKKTASTYQRFFSEKVEEVPGFKISLSDIFDEFKQYVDRGFQSKRNTFVTQMERLIGKPITKGGSQFYVGFRIRGTSGEALESDDE